MADRQGGGLFGGGGDLMVSVEIFDRAAVADHMAGEAPLLTQHRLQQIRVGAAGFGVEAVIGPHDRFDLALGDGRLERGQIGVPQVARADGDIEPVAEGLGTAVHRIVLGAGRDFQVAPVAPLQAFDEGHSQATGEVGVFAVGFMAAPPARVAEDVDVRAPEGQSQAHDAVVQTARRVVLGAGFVGYGLPDPVHERGIPRCRQTDGLGKDSGLAGTGHSVQALVPPDIPGDPQAPDRRGVVPYLRDLLFECHASQQVLNAVCQGSVGIQVQRRGRTRGACRWPARGRPAWAALCMIHS